VFLIEKIKKQGNPNITKKEGIISGFAVFNSSF
jgi:hypothetical protein